ncbi:tRNA splicing endonuclease subunit sen2 [Coemansia sp. RSA 1804]|nr:tRNA splicing endonuclease subunit sen2 [Coemansia sp. RSA 1804]
MDVEDTSGDQQQQQQPQTKRAQRKRAPRAKHKNVKVTASLPMVRQAAIFPQVGRFLDTLAAAMGNGLLRRIAPTKIPPVLLRLCALAASIWKRYAAAPLKRLYALVVPRNMFWAPLVPRKIHAMVHVVRRVAASPIDGGEEDGQGQPVDCCIWVRDGWKAAWSGGAFGKGILSRSDPTWENRHRRDVAAAGAGSKGEVYLEDITRQRRQDRKQQQMETDVDNGGVLPGTLKDPEPAPEPEQQAAALDDEASRMEPLQLSPYEALFLSDIGCLEATDAGNSSVRYGYADLWHILAATAPCRGGEADDFALRYAAYYYYRAKGWVVRCGIKFGSDFLLYAEGGPTKSHAPYSVIVRRLDSAAPTTTTTATTTTDGGDSEQTRQNQDGAERPRGLAESWQYMFALNRVTAQAKKSLLVCYVGIPNTCAGENEEMEEGSIMHGHVKAQRRPPDLHAFRIQEFVVQRFNPNKWRE